MPGTNDELYVNIFTLYFLDNSQYFPCKIIFCIFNTETSSNNLVNN